MSLNISKIFNTNEQITSPLSYGMFLQDIKNFKKAGTRNGGEFNYLDTPAHLYFKILFNFWNGDIDNPGNKEFSGGLLSPTWITIGSDTDYYNYNSAWSYLKMNNENERAEKLEKFVELLSNINMKSPWYFQSIEGLDAARARNAPNGDVKFDERNKISIKCLKDSYDDRIGTLIDLYRDIVWSWSMKREVVPSNLRKFDMAIYIFSSPIFTIHDYSGNYASVGPIGQYITSYKYLEFHNCEIDYNSGTSMYAGINNTEGVEPEYSIDIYYDDCYENRYNEYMMRNIGDMVAWDVASNTVNADGSNNDFLIESSPQTDDLTHENEINNRTFYYDNNGGILSKMVGDVINAGVDRLNEFITSKYLGNIYGFSLKKSITDINNVLDGKIFNTISAAKDFVDNVKSKPKTMNLGTLGNIFTKKSISTNI